MELHELGIINAHVDHFANYYNGIIDDLFIICKDDEIHSFVYISFDDSNKKRKKGIFSYDILKKKILPSNRKQCEMFFPFIDKVLGKNVLSTLIKYIKKSKKDIELIEFENNFVPIDNNVKLTSYEAISEVIIKDINKKIKNEVCVFHESRGPGKIFININTNNILKKDFQNINFSSILEVSIKCGDKTITDFGNVIRLENNADKLEMILEPIASFLLSRQILDNMNFKNVSIGEIVNLIINSTKAVRTGKIDLMDTSKRKFKYISILNNFEIYEEELFVGDVVFSKKIRDIDKSKLKSTSNKYVYISTYVVADTINEAKQEALTKINNILNFIELIQKNSCFFKMYNKSKKINTWKIEDLFIDYKLSDCFLIYNVLLPKQCVYGSNKNFILKNYGQLTSNSEIIEFKEQLERVLFNYNDKKNKLINAVFWLNNSIRAVNYDINQSIIYINIAIEYSASNEKPYNYSEKYPNLENILNELKGIIKEKKLEPDQEKMINEGISKIQKDNSINARFFLMLKRLGIELTDHQKENYKKIRQGRNDIIHNNKKIDINQQDLIECYMTISKIIFYKITEGTNEYI